MLILRRTMRTPSPEVTRYHHRPSDCRRSRHADVHNAAYDHICLSQGPVIAKRADTRVTIGVWKGRPPNSRACDRWLPEPGIWRYWVLDPETIEAWTRWRGLHDSPAAATVSSAYTRNRARVR